MKTIVMAALGAALLGETCVLIHQRTIISRAVVEHRAFEFDRAALDIYWSNWCGLSNQYVDLGSRFDAVQKERDTFSNESYWQETALAALTDDDAQKRADAYNKAPWNARARIDAAVTRIQNAQNHEDFTNWEAAIKPLRAERDLLKQIVQQQQLAASSQKIMDDYQARVDQIDAEFNRAMQTEAQQEQAEALQRLATQAELNGIGSRFGH